MFKTSRGSPVGPRLMPHGLFRGAVPLRKQKGWSRGPDRVKNRRVSSLFINANMMWLRSTGYFDQII
jgi:hypothetical protein